MKDLKDIIADYAFSKMDDHGLLLLPLPTGAGKSYTVFNFIHDTLVSGTHKEKIIFITSLKKNLQPEELKEQFKESEEELFNNKVLYLKSNLDCVLNHLRPLDEGNTIPERIKELNEYKSLWSATKFCLDMANNSNFGVQDAVKTKKDEIQNNLERSFRQKIRKLLDSDIKKNLGPKVGYKEKLEFIRNPKNKWMWLLKLYPQILTKERQVFLMSMDKFLLRNDPIIEKNYFIYKELAKDSIIFIDEFDATKETVLNRLIENAVKAKIDYVSAFKQIHDRLMHGDFPSEMTTASQRQLDSEAQGYGQKKLEEVIPRWKKISDEIYERFDMNYVFKNIESEESDSSFLFQDIHSMAISGNDKSKNITIKKRDEKRVNEISYLQDNAKEDRDDKNFKHMVRDVRGFLKYFCGGVQILATNLVQLKNQNGDEEYSYEDAVSSIVDNFIPDDSLGNMKRFFVDEILLYHRNKEENKKKELDGSFFENGFSYFAIEDDNQHSLRSSITMTALESTPEKLLLEICSNAKVFGISATANYDTVIGNYAVGNYIIPKLKNHYYELDSDENRVLRQHFEKSIAHYDKVNINTIAIGKTEKYSQESWKVVFSNDDDCEEIYNRINQGLSGNKDEDSDYNKNRYLRIALLFKQFIETDEIKSLLCLLTKFPHTDNVLNNEILRQIFDALAAGKLTYKDNVRILRSGNNYELEKEEILNELKNGGKVMVISTYQTIGAGQNLLYDIPDFLKKKDENENGPLIHINDFNPSEKKDFDAIYLDKPTNLLTQLKSSSEEKNFVKFISQVEYLKESGELSIKESNRLIREAFRLKFYGGRDLKMSQTELDSFSNYATKVIVQAVGRICRRNVKNPNIYIFYDVSIADVINKNACGTNLLNPEFEKLLIKINSTRQPDTTEKKLINEAINKSDEALTKIIKYVSDGRKGWKENAMNEWQQIRKFVLLHPTLSKDEFNKANDLFQPLYVRLPKTNNELWFKRVGDYDDFTMSFSPQSGYESVSSQSARLEKFLRLPSVKELFNTEGFSEDFEQNDYIICPPVFTNIYKGALGEYAGKRIFDTLNIELEEITDPNCFELFDYKVKNKEVYVDFKHWNQYSAFLPKNVEEMQNHIFEKMEKCGTSKVLIVNIFAEELNLRKLLSAKRDDLEIVELPFLYDENTFKLNGKISEIFDEVNA